MPSSSAHSSRRTDRGDSERMTPVEEHITLHVLAKRIDHSPLYPTMTDRGILGGVRALDDLLRVQGLGTTRTGAAATDMTLEEARTRGYP